jgi:hypothetical protein
MNPYPHPSAGHPSANHPNAGHPNAGHPNAGHPNAGHPMGSHPLPAHAPPVAYEFGEAENKVIRGTAHWTRQGGLMMIVFGGIFPLFGGAWSVLHGSFSGITQVLLALLNLFFGITLVTTARRFNAVVTTQGNDIPLLMDGLRGYQRVYKVLAIVVFIAFVLGVAVALLVGIRR